MVRQRHGVPESLRVRVTDAPTCRWPGCRKVLAARNASGFCREFPNEAEVIDQAGWVILVERPGLEPLPGAHVSEAGVPDNLISFDLLNDSTIEKLAEKTGCLAEYIQREYASTEAL